MRILHLHERIELKGGAEVYISQLQQLLPSFGQDSFWLGINDFTGAFEVSESGVPGFSKKFSEQKELFSFLRNYLKEKQIEVISIHNIFDPRLIAFCFGQLPVVKFAHGPVMVCPGKDKFWRYSERSCSRKFGLHCFWHIYSEGCSNRHPKRVMKAWEIVNYEIGEAAHRYHKIVVMSEFIRNGLLEVGVPEKSVICIPYFTPVVENPASESVESDKRELLFLGRLISSKGPHIMIEAVEPLLKDKDDIVLNIVGDGIMKSELIELVEKKGLNHKIIFHGWLNREQTNRMLNDCDIVIFPSVYPEAFGIVGIEAMMRAKPVVAFDVGGVSTWLRNGETGFMVDVKNRKAMQESLRALLENELLYDRMSKKARAVALESYTPNSHITKLLNIYKEAIG